jgi:hypothetical protein
MEVKRQSTLRRLLEAEGMLRSALKMPAEFGVKTLVRDDSAKNLPTDLDREKEQALPLPGSATPGGAGRDISKFEYNTPNNDIDKRPRTLSVPGEDYGVPSKNDYNTVTRRTMTSAVNEIAIRDVMAQLILAEIDEGFDKEGFQQTWTRGKRQRRQRGQDRQKARAYYRRNKSKIKRQSKMWRRLNKNKGAFKTSERRRRRTTRTRRGSIEQPCAACIAETFLREAKGDFAPPKERGGTNGRRQREQMKDEQYEDAQYYKRHKSERKRQSLRHYNTLCVHNRRCKERRREWEENPGWYERGRPQRRREAGLLTVPEIAFGIGPDMKLGYVRSLSPLTGMVTFEIDDDDRRIWESLPVGVFMRVAAFLSDEDLDAFFELVDAEIGEEAYDDLDEESLRECAALFDKDPDSDQFKSQCFDLTGEEDLGRLSTDQLEQVNNTLVLGILEGGGEAGDRDEGDDTIGEEFDPHLFYGEVEMEKAEEEEASEE